MSKPKAAKEGGATSNENAPRARAPAHGNGLVNASQAPAAITSPTTARDIMDMLASRFTPADLGDRLDGFLNAEITYVTQAGVEKTKPDQPTRLKGLELIMAYLVGRPVERQEIITHSQPASLDDLMAKAKQSPVFRDALIAMLQHLTEGGNAKDMP